MAGGSGSHGGGHGVNPPRRLARLASTQDFREAARRRLPRSVFDFIDGGSGHEYTLRANEDAFRQWIFRSRVLVDTSGLDISTTVLGTKISMPLLLGPSGAQKTVHPKGEIAVARAAAAAGTIYVLGVASSHTLEEVAQSVPAGSHLWFQLYLWQGREWAVDLLRRVKDAGYETLVVTLDIKAPGGRKYRDIRNQIHRMPDSLGVRTLLDASRRPRWVWRYLTGGPIRMVHMIEGGKAATMFNATEATYRRMDPATTWDEVRWIRSLWDGPIVVKGVLSEEDAKMAYQCGVDGVMCSNHGGRNLDGNPATLDVLPRLAEVAQAAGKEVYLDGGVRTGGDVVKALALGANACFMVRPFFWGLTLGGQVGVESVLEVFRAEIASTMSYVGRPRVTDISMDAVERYPVEWPG